MTWLRISDDFTDRQELLELGDREALAGWTYLRLLCWSARQLSDGLIPVGVARREDAVGIAALESIGYVIRRKDGGLELPRFLSDHALSRAAVLESRAHLHSIRSEAGRRGQASKKAKAEARAQAKAEANSKHGGGFAVANGKQTTSPVSRIPLPGNPVTPKPVSLSLAPAGARGREIESDHV